jgi:predicted nucleic acid-binding protein
MRFGTDKSARSAWQVLAALVAAKAHRFVADDIAYVHVGTEGLLGHAQVTDAYLAALARHNGLRLATFDRGLAQSHPDIAEFVGA